ncbi:hypothetical protein BC351_39860 [Paenibacillus ferrarius]|uniref:Uncharacterized protein n=1 Tax=Paenibacillus ferrarius TaxID=1469647 RepID=A0A1V4H897_9BACL|nr:hypothetical protein [Paenibacillus ferrarius]OPH47437.1 hypothetical protein BC351_39860 [Paenibacillus ferrarius]
MKLGEKLDLFVKIQMITDDGSGGDVFDVCGFTEKSTSLHLHFEIFVNGRRFDPAPLIGLLCSVYFAKWISCSLDGSYFAPISETKFLESIVIESQSDRHSSPITTHSRMTRALPITQGGAPTF